MAQCILVKNDKEFTPPHIFLLNPNYVAVNNINPVHNHTSPLIVLVTWYYTIKFKRKGEEAVPLMARKNILCGWLSKKHAKIK